MLIIIIIVFKWLIIIFLSHCVMRKQMPYVGLSTIDEVEFHEYKFAVLNMHWLSTSLYYTRLKFGRKRSWSDCSILSILNANSQSIKQESLILEQTVFKVQYTHSLGCLFLLTPANRWIFWCFWLRVNSGTGIFQPKAQLDVDMWISFYYMCMVWHTPAVCTSLHKPRSLTQHIK